MKTFKFADTSVFLHDQDLPDLLDYKDEIGIDTETTGLFQETDYASYKLGFLEKNVI